MWRTPLVIFALGTGCMGQVSGDGEQRAYMMSLNSLSLNGLDENGIHVNGIHVNGVHLSDFALGGLHLRELSLNGLSTTESRDIMGYVVACALRPEQTITISEDVAGAFSWTGALGLAPDWHVGPLDLAGQERVSACLLAHANSRGQHVSISLFSPQLPVEPAESNYTLGDAIFAGNVFKSPAEMYVWGNIGPYASAIPSLAAEGRGAAYDRVGFPMLSYQGEGGVQCGITEMYCDANSTLCVPNFFAGDRRPGMYMAESSHCRAGDTDVANFISVSVEWN
jgi:hypothetical protein